MSSDSFKFIVNEVRGVAVVALVGELDLASADGLVDRLVGIPGSPVVVDLAQLAFLDSSGISSLVLTKNQMDMVGRTLLLTRPTARVLQTLEIVGLAGWVSTWSSDWAE
jgi:anti-sigma B factor antagonist